MGAKGCWVKGCRHWPGQSTPRAGSEEGAGWEMIPGDGKDKKEVKQGYLRRVLDDT